MILGIIIRILSISIGFILLVYGNETGKRWCMALGAVIVFFGSLYGGYVYGSDSEECTDTSNTQYTIMFNETFEPDTLVDSSIVL